MDQKAATVFEAQKRGTHMIARTEGSRSADERLDFVSEFVGRAVNTSDSSKGDLLEWSLQTALRQIARREYDLAISSLCQSVRETQSVAAYLLLAEAYLRDRQIEMALVTLDVLEYVESGLPEAKVMKGFVLREKGDHEESRKYFCAAVSANPSLRLAWKMLIDLALDRGDPHEAARLLSEALRYSTRNGHLMEMQRNLAEVESACHG
jgi:tetratricopeptide (TPR) repeat protein